MRFHIMEQVAGGEAGPWSSQVRIPGQAQGGSGSSTSTCFVQGVIYRQGLSLNGHLGPWGKAGCEACAAQGC